MSEFEYLNLEQLKESKKRLEDYKVEFDNIVIRFGEINDKLLKEWEGKGANAYYHEVSDILDNLGNLDEAINVMDEIYQDLILKLQETDTTLATETIAKGLGAGAEAGAGLSN